MDTQARYEVGQQQEYADSAGESVQWDCISRHASLSEAEAALAVERAAAPEWGGFAIWDRAAQAFLPVAPLTRAERRRELQALQTAAGRVVARQYGEIAEETAGLDSSEPYSIRRWRRAAAQWDHPWYFRWREEWRAVRDRIQELARLGV